MRSIQPVATPEKRPITNNVSNQYRNSQILRLDFMYTNKIRNVLEPQGGSQIRVPDIDDDANPLPTGGKFKGLWLRDYFKVVSLPNKIRI